MNNKKSLITEMSDSAFVSFLYSERERENSLSQYHGWNNWALAGAIITVVCFIYATVKDDGEIDSMRCFYYTTGSIAFFLAYHSLLSFFKRERGHDFTRVRLLKEKTPWIDAVLVIITSVAAIVLILIYDDSSDVLWAWLVALIAQVVAVTFAIINRNRVVPFYFVRPYFTRLWCNIGYDGLAGGLLSLAGGLSFKKASWCILDPEFEIGICIGSIAVILYFLVKINIENKPVKQFDVILDMYLYTDVSKEETYNEVLCNRMGYGVVDVCKKELSNVRVMSDSCNEKAKELEAIESKIKSGQYDIDQIPEYSKRIKDSLFFLKKTLQQSARLTSRLAEIVKVAPVLNQVADIDAIFDANKVLYTKVEDTYKVLDGVQQLVSDEFDKYYCNKSNSLCPNISVH